MAQLSLTEISKRFNVNRTTIYRAVNSGKISRLDNGLFDLSEVLRVFGERAPGPAKGSIQTPVNNTNDREIIAILKSQVELLTNQLEQKDSQIDHLQRLLVAPETSQQQQNTTPSNDTPQQSETPDIQGIQQNETSQETISNVTKQQGDTPHETSNLIGRFRRGFNAFLK